MKWEREDFLGDAVTTAQKLIGAVIVRRSSEGVTAGRIVECEAYGEIYKGHKDDGAHVFKGLTPRTRIIFGEGGSCLRIPHLRHVYLPQFRLRP